MYWMQSIKSFSHMRKKNLVLIYVCDGIPRYATDRSEILWKSGEVLFPKDKISAKYPDHHPTR